jgi:hypothetical protein
VLAKTLCVPLVAVLVAFVVAAITLVAFVVNNWSDVGGRVG